MTPITISATTSYVTNASLQPFDYTPYDAHQDMDIAIDRNGNSHIVSAPMKVPVTYTT